MLVPSASASFSLAAFSEMGKRSEKEMGKRSEKEMGKRSEKEMGKRSEKVDTLVVLFLSPLVLPPGFGAEFRRRLPKRFHGLRR